MNADFLETTLNTEMYVAKDSFLISHSLKHNKVPNLPLTEEAQSRMHSD